MCMGFNSSHPLAGICDLASRTTIIYQGYPITCLDKDVGSEVERLRRYTTIRKKRNKTKRKTAGCSPPHKKALSKYAIKELMCLESTTGICSRYNIL